jgi:pSer/pThr/pTyr-binding forkhead associated (FHA) protein
MTGPSTNVQLFCHLRAGVTLSFKLGENSVIGRDEANAVAVPVEGVSRMHARIRFDGKSYWLEDLKSTNGTFLNGQAVTRDRLRHLDVITLGKELDLVFVARAAAEVQKYQAIVRAALLREGVDAAPYEIAPGEITLGRAASNNLVAEAGAVSKLHARIERTRAQLVLQDLGSANGTFVNGARVTEVFLKDGDAVSLAGVEGYKVVVEMGEVTSASGRHSAASIAGAGEAGRSRFSAEWKTRFDWSEEERGALAELRRQLEERETDNQSRREQSDKSRPPAGKPASPAKPAAPAAPVKPTVASAPTPSAPDTPVAPKPADRAVPPPVKAAAAPSVSTAAPPVRVSGAAPGTAPAPPPAPKPGVPARSPALPVAAPPGVTSPNPASPAVVRPPTPAVKSLGPIVAVRLTGAGFSLVVTQPGEYDVGRSREAALCIDHPTVSRKHARLILSDDRGSVFLQEQGGANGTRHNGQEVTKLARLTDQDTIGLGQVDLKVSLERG